MTETEMIETLVEKTKEIEKKHSGETMSAETKRRIVNEITQELERVVQSED
ncbi:MAG: hypothetical protein FWD76_01625 [Firmicutes bacterium]|nr:hypothetical protein [Bacillota bacterium]